MANINEVYYGRALSKNTQKINKRRIDYVVQKMSLFINNSTFAPASFLDIGCGSGIVTHLMSEKTNAICVGVDKNEEAIKYANEHNEHDAIFIQDDFTKYFTDVDGNDLRISGYSDEWHNKKYNVVHIGEVLEHFSHPHKLINIINRYVANQGWLIVTVPWGYNLTKGHLHYFYESDLMAMFVDDYKLLQLFKEGYFIYLIGQKMHTHSADRYNAMRIASMLQHDSVLKYQKQIMEIDNQF